MMIVLEARQGRREIPVAGEGMAKKSLLNPAKTDTTPQTGLQIFPTLMKMTYFRTSCEQALSDSNRSLSEWHSLTSEMRGTR